VQSGLDELDCEELLEMQGQPIAPSRNVGCLPLAVWSRLKAIKFSGAVSMSEHTATTAKQFALSVRQDE
jgi:hypothetical protein